ncbi:MAG TPA: murein biosynthesis integral membrane protein MurJ [Candidatus Binatia bacterium]|nr:murein biosynthesis integral membrane protein MurJ [Candidatus Binatia bacterium]
MEAEESAPAAAALPTPTREPPAGADLARQASVVSVAVLASRVVGLVREQTLAFLFGAGRELDAFVTAFRVPNLFRDLFAEGALSAAFVTTFTHALERDGEAAAWRLASLVVNALAVVVGGVVLLGVLGAPALVGAIAPGFAEIPGKLPLTVRLTAIMFPFLLLVALAAVAMGILNTRNVFAVPAAAGAFFNVGSVVGGLACAAWLAPDYLRLALHGGADGAAPLLAERAITGMAVGTLVGGLCQLGVQLPALRRTGFRYRPVLDPRDPRLREVLRLMGPATIGAAAVQVNVFVNSNFASYLGNGPVSWLNVAFRFMQLPIGLFGVAIGTVTLPAVSRQSARGDVEALGRTVGEALELVALLCIPAAAGLALFGVPLVGLVYEHGRFGPADTAAAAQALAGYALGLAGYAGIKVLAPSFFALGDARIPMLVSLLSIGTNWALNWTFVRALHLGHVGLAISTSAVALGNCVLLYAFLCRRIGPLGRGLGRALARIGVATAVMLLAAAAADAALAPHLPVRPLAAYALRVATILGTAGAAFATACAALGVALPRRLLRRGRGGRPPRRARPAPPG